LKSISDQIPLEPS